MSMFSKSEKNAFLIFSLDNMASMNSEHAMK